MRKYPFSPDILAELPQELELLFRDLEMKLLDEICSRLVIADQLNEVTVQDIRALRQHGIDLKQIKKAIRDATGIGEAKLNELLDDVVKRNQKYYTELIDAARVTQPEYIVSGKDIDAIKRQTMEEFTNLTRTMAFLTDNGRTVTEPAKAFQWACDSALMQVQSGAISYNQAVANAVKQLADSGLRVVSYESGHVDQIDVAARRAVMTGVSQVCAKYTEQSAEWLDSPYFEVSAHAGARDTGIGWQDHKSWQGRVYSTQPNDIYPNIYDVCGLGEVDGLEGANCRHRRFVWVEGVSERTYTDEQLANIDQPPFEYDGKKYTTYEATQMQRRVENTVRKLEREKAAVKDFDPQQAQAINIKIRRLKNKYHEFSAAAGLREQPERMKVIFSGKNVDKQLKLEKQDVKLINRQIASQRTLAMGLRTEPSKILDEEEIKSIKEDAKALNIDENILVFNSGKQTGFVDSKMIINIRGDILPDTRSVMPRDIMSARAALAHEYYGHYMHHPSRFRVGDWRDEFRASYMAAVNAPNLTDEDRSLLMLDAFDRAKEAGVSIKYNSVARRVIHGYDE